MDDTTDYLTVSASLVHILSLLDQSDILICKLVCRRLDDVILKNSFRMPRRRISLYINFPSVATERKICLELYPYEPYGVPGASRTWIIIEENQVSILATSKGVEEFFRNEGATDIKCSAYFRGFKPCRSRHQTLPGELWKLRNPILVLPVQLHFRTNSMEEGLDLIMSLVLRRYGIQDSYLIDENGDDYMGKLLEIIGRQPTRPKWGELCIKTPLLKLNLQLFAKSIDCYDISVCYNELPIDKLLEGFTHWEKRICVILRQRVLDCPAPIIDILKRWQNGSIPRIKRLELRNELNTSSGVPPNWSQREFVEILERNLQEPLDIRYGEDGYPGSMRLRRSLDATVLNIVYWRHPDSRHILINEPGPIIHTKQLRSGQAPKLLALNNSMSLITN